MDLGNQLPCSYCTRSGTADWQTIRWASPLAGAFASSTFTFLKSASRKGLKECHFQNLTIQSVSHLKVPTEET